MDLDRHLAEVELRGDLLVHQPADDEAQNFPLSLRQRREGITQGGARLLEPQPFTVARQGTGNGIEHVLIPKRFGQKVHRTGLHGLDGHGDIAMTVKAMKAGAVDFLAKPFRDQDMLDAVASALARDSERLRLEQSGAALRDAFAALTQREREVLRFVISGLMNKQIAAQLNLSEVTVKVHRGQVMKKLGARSVADLVRMAESLGVEPSHRSA